MTLKNGNNFSKSNTALANAAHGSKKQKTDPLKRAEERLSKTNSRMQVLEKKVDELIHKLSTDKK